MLLPIETPVVDRDERDDGAIRQDGRHFHFASQLVHVRSHVEQIGVHRQHVRRADVLLAASRANVQIIVRQHELSRLASSGRRSKVEPDRRPITLSLSRRMIVDQKNQVRLRRNLAC